MIIAPNDGEGKWAFFQRAATAARLLGFGKSFRELGIPIARSKGESVEKRSAFLKADADERAATEYDSLPPEERDQYLASPQNGMSDQLRKALSDHVDT